MNEQERADVMRALDNVKSNTYAQVYLRRALGEEIEYEETNGHLFKPECDNDEWCVHSGCEMTKGALRYASDLGCPASCEGIDIRRPLCEGCFRRGTNKRASGWYCVDCDPEEEQ